MPSDAYTILMKIIEKLKEIIRGLGRGSSNKETRELTYIEKRSTCPECIGSMDKIDDSENKAPCRESRISRREDI
ncbi:MAG: hypothetical protein ACLFU5_08185 [Thermoplasmata archaeon]